MSLGEESLESVQYNQYLHVLPYVAAHKHAAAVAVRSVREGEIGDVAHLTNGNLHTRLTLAQLPNGLGWEMKAWEDKESSGVNFPEPLTDFRRRLDVVFMAGAISLVGTDEDDSIDRRPTSGELTAIKDILWGARPAFLPKATLHWTEYKDGKTEEMPYCQTRKSVFEEISHIRDRAYLAHEISEDSYVDHMPQSREDFCRVAGVWNEQGVEGLLFFTPRSIFEDTPIEERAIRVCLETDSRLHFYLTDDSLVKTQSFEVRLDPLGTQIYLFPQENPIDAGVMTPFSRGFMAELLHAMEIQPHPDVAG